MQGFLVDTYFCNKMSFTVMIYCVPMLYYTSCKQKALIQVEEGQPAHHLLLLATVTELPSPQTHCSTTAPARSVLWGALFPKLCLFFRKSTYRIQNLQCLTSITLVYYQIKKMHIVREKKERQTLNHLFFPLSLLPSRLFFLVKGTWDSLCHL